MTIGNTIATLRKEKGMTQEALANALGVTNQAVSKWESEQSCPDIALLPGIADLFAVSLDYLFGRESTVQHGCDLPWEDDGTLRVVIFQGKTYLQSYPEAKEICLEMDGLCVENVECACSLSIDGNVGGNVTAKGSIKCDSVLGHVSAGGSVNCDDVHGNVQAGGSVNCDDVGCDVNAGGSVQCDSVKGSITASRIVTAFTTNE